MTSEWTLSPAGDYVKTATYECKEPGCTFKLEYEYAWKDPQLNVHNKQYRKFVRKVIRKHWKSHGL